MTDEKRKRRSAIPFSEKLAAIDTRIADAEHRLESLRVHRLAMIEDETAKAAAIMAGVQAATSPAQPATPDADAEMEADEAR